MTWEEVRAHYPNQWIILEAHQWEDGDDERHISEMSVVRTVEDAGSALRESNTLLQAHPPRIFYPAHTSTSTPRIKPPRVRIPHTYERYPAPLPPA